MRRVHLATISLLCFAVVAIAQACSLFIPFDEYAGPRDAGADGAADASLLDAGDAGDAANCKDVDTRSDPMHCGVCGRACVNGGACDAGHCPIEIVVPPGAGAISWMNLAADPVNDAGAYLYFTRESGLLGRVEVTTGSGVESAPANVVGGGQVSVNHAGVTGVVAGDASIASFGPSDFASAVPKTLVTDHPGVGPLVLSGTLVYWGDRDGLWWATVKNNPPLSSFDGGPPPVAMTLTTNLLFWTGSDGTVNQMSATVPGSPALVIAQGLDGVTSIAVAKKTLYLGQKSQGLLVYDLDDASRATTLARKVTIPDPEAVVTDIVHVYVVDIGSGKAGGRVVRTTLDATGNLIPLAENLTATRAIALGPEYVYFADGSSILRTTK